MITSDPARHERLAALFEEAWQLDHAQREGFLRSLRDQDQALTEPLRELLHRAVVADSWLEQPALEGADQALLLRALDSPSGLPASIGRYDITGILGEGGAAIVYRAMQREPVRRVAALKVIKSGLDSRGIVARFRAEWQALAMMNHPNIARILDVGLTPEGSRSYLAMECIDGPCITEHCRANGLSVRQRLQLFLSVCDAVQHAHGRGIIHRDLKPSNILVAIEDGIAIPKIIDFGVAKAIEGGSLGPATLTTQVILLGTPNYMSPEQARGEVDVRSDVYALGTVLFELMAERPAFDRAGLTPHQALRDVMDMRPPRLAAVNRAFRGDIDTIVATAMERDPARRYATVAELARDIERHLDGRPIQARPASAAYVLSRFVTRHRAISVAAVLVAAAIISLAAVSLVAWRHAERARAQARDTADFLIREVVAELADTAGAAATRRVILQRVVDECEQHFVENPDDPSLQHVYAQALSRLGDIEREQGRAAESLVLQRQAHQIIERLVQANPNDWQGRHALSIAKVHVGDLAKESGDLITALGLYREAFAIDEQMAKERPDDRLGVDSLAWSCERVGDLLHRLGDEEWALALHRRRLELAEQVCRMAPDRPGAIFGLYMAHGQLAALAGQYGNETERDRHMQAAYELARGLAQREPGNRQYAVALAGSLRGLAADDLNAGRTDQAMQHASEARQLIMPLVESDPEHLDGLEAAATIHSFFADAAARRGDWPEALREHREARSTLETLRSRRPDNPIHRMHLCSVHGSLEAVAQAIGDEALRKASRNAMAAICREVLADPKAAAGDLAGCAQWWATNHLVTEQDRVMALAGAERAAEQTGQRMPRMQLALAEVQWRVGQQEQALATLDRAIAATPVADRIEDGPERADFNREVNLIMSLFNMQQ